LLARKFQVPRAHAIGEKAEVPDADEALGQDVKQVTAQELVGRKIHGLLAITIAVVLVEEAHKVAVEAEDAAVGDGDAMGVGSEIAENLLGTAEGTLCVDDLLVARRSRKEILSMLDAGAKGAVVAKVLTQHLHEAAAEVTRQDAYWKKEVLATGTQPATTVERKASGGNDTVDVRMKRERLPPCMQHSQRRRCARRAAWDRWR
jgi:hypothetical protein